MLEWYALQVHHKKEKITARLLQYKGFDPYLPTYPVKRRWSDRVKLLDEPLFPGYVFCKLDLGVSVPIVTTPGVFRIVGSGPKPTAIPEKEIDMIARIVSSTVPAEPWPYIACGDRVTISHGPLRGVEGIFVSVKNNFKIVVSITLLQRSMAVEVERDAVLPSSVARHLRG